MANAYEWLIQAAMIILGLSLFVCMYRAIKGPATTDRVLAVNMIGTDTMLIIILLAMLMKQGYLVDIALIYAMLSFLAVVLLCKIFIGIHRARKEKEGKKDA